MNNHRSPWSLTEMRYLERHYGRSKTRDIAKKLGRTPTAIRLQAQKLGYCQSKRSRWSEGEKEQVFASYRQGEGIESLQKSLPHRGVLEILCHSSKLPQKGMTDDTTFRF